MPLQPHRVECINKDIPVWSVLRRHPGPSYYSPDHFWDFRQLAKPEVVTKKRKNQVWSPLTTRVTGLVWGRVKACLWSALETSRLCVMDSEGKLIIFPQSGLSSPYLLVASFFPSFVLSGSSSPLCSSQHVCFLALSSPPSVLHQLQK